MEQEKLELYATILNQLGGKKFSVMVGMKDLSAAGNYIQFKIGRNSSKANLVRVELMGDDTYTMTFMSFRGVNIKILKEFTGVYCDQLENIFSSFTGMATRLF